MPTWTEVVAADADDEGAMAAGNDEQLRSHDVTIRYIALDNRNHSLQPTNGYLLQLQWPGSISFSQLYSLLFLARRILLEVPCPAALLPITI